MTWNKIKHACIILFLAQCLKYIHYGQPFSLSSVSSHCNITFMNSTERFELRAVKITNYRFASAI